MAAMPQDIEAQIIPSPNLSVLELLQYDLPIPHPNFSPGQTAELSNFAELEEGGEVPTLADNPGPAINLLTSDPLAASSTSSKTATGEGRKRKRIANKWYPMKNFIRHDDEDSSDHEEETL